MKTIHRWSLLLWVQILVFSPVLSALLRSQDVPDKGKQAYEKLKSADKLRSSGNIAEAVNTYLEGANLYEEALKEQPDKSAYKNNYKYCLGKRGYIQLIHAKKLAEQKKFREAADFYAAAIKAYEYALSKLPGNSGFKNNIKYSRINGAKARFSHMIAAKTNAPPFKLEAFNGTTLDSDSLKGKVVLLEFWAGWCGSCKRALPLLQEVRKKYASRGLEVVALSVDRVKGWAKGGWDKKALEQSKTIDFKFAWATEQTTLDYGSFPSIPTIYLIDKQGRLAGRITSDERTVAIMSGMIEKLL